MRQIRPQHDIGLPISDEAARGKEKAPAEFRAGVPVNSCHQVPNQRISTLLECCILKDSYTSLAAVGSV